MLYKHRIHNYLLLLGIALIFLLTWKNLQSSNNSSMYHSLSSNYQNSISSNNSLEIQIKTGNIAEFRILTAFSSNHFDEALRNCKIIGKLDETKNWMSGYMIAYILQDDVSREQQDKYRNECPFVTLRKFNASKYSNFVSQNIYEYRWKPLIVYEVMKEVEKVFWIDASVILKNDANEKITDIISKMDTKFTTCGLRDFGDAGHSIIYATHPKMLQYFNFPEDTAKKSIMIAGGLFIISKKYGMNILEKWKDCALKKECMAPTGHSLYCSCKDDCKEKNMYGDCHRYDQSALSILAYQCSTNSSDFYESTTLLDVQIM